MTRNSFDFFFHNKVTFFSHFTFVKLTLFILRTMSFFFKKSVFKIIWSCRHDMLRMNWKNWRSPEIREIRQKFAQGKSIEEKGWNRWRGKRMYTKFSCYGILFDKNKKKTNEIKLVLKFSLSTVHVYH